MSTGEKQENHPAFPFSPLPSLMTVRSLDFLDLPFLSRYSQDVLPLYSAYSVTRGNPLNATALLSSLNPRRNLYTAIATENGNSLIGQIALTGEGTTARLVFLAPGRQLGGLALSLLDHLSKQAGEWGALYLLAEVDEDSLAFPLLRQAGFAMYAWQRVWKLPAFPTQTDASVWRPAQETDWPAVQSLHGQIVPAMLHVIEELPRQASGLVCAGEGGLQAYTSLTTGPVGVWIQPLVPPDSGCFPAQLLALVRANARWKQRTAAVCVRSYQAWLETPLAELGAGAGPRQAVMVKRLAKTVKEAQVVPAMEQVLGKAKPAAPVSRAEGKK